MKYTDVLNFKKHCVDPVMSKLYDRIKIQNGDGFIDFVDVSIPDYRSYGIDSNIVARGYICIDGAVQKYEFESSDISMQEFIDRHSAFHFVEDGQLIVWDECMETTINTKLSKVELCGKIIDFLNGCILSVEPVSLKYEKMKNLCE